MFDSFAPYVLMMVAVVMLLVAILATRKKQEKLAKQTGKRTDEMGTYPVRFKQFESVKTEEVFLDLREPPKETPQVFAVELNTALLIVCDGCHAHFYGDTGASEHLRKGKCPQCKTGHTRLVEIRRWPAPREFLVISERRFDELIRQFFPSSVMFC